MQIIPRLWVSDISACNHLKEAVDREGTPKMVIVHACKFPCHRDAVGYKEAKTLSPSHPHYLYLERGNHLYLNMIDPPVPLFKLELFDTALEFITRNYDEENTDVLIHCNCGQSRAPSLALLFLARRGELGKVKDFKTAKKVFTEKYYPAYAPGKGIEMFMIYHWKYLMGED